MKKGSLGSMLLGLISLYLIISIIFMPLGVILFKKWLDLEGDE